VGILASQLLRHCATALGSSNSLEIPLIAFKFVLSSLSLSLSLSL
jgi:hypothetical protein